MKKSRTTCCLSIEVSVFVIFSIILVQHFIKIRIVDLDVHQNHWRSAWNHYVSSLYSKARSSPYCCAVHLDPQPIYCQYVKSDWEAILKLIKTKCFFLFFNTLLFTYLILNKYIMLIMSSLCPSLLFFTKGNDREKKRRKEK